MTITPSGQIAAIQREGDTLTFESNPNGTIVRFTPRTVDVENATVIGAVAAFDGKFIYLRKFEANAYIEEHGGKISGDETALLNDLAALFPEEGPREAARAPASKLLKDTIARVITAADEALAEGQTGSAVLRSLLNDFGAVATNGRAHH